jgi:Flp pilus assembly protein TadB
MSFEKEDFDNHVWSDEMLAILEREKQERIAALDKRMQDRRRKQKRADVLETIQAAVVAIVMVPTMFIASVMMAVITWIPMLVALLLICWVASKIF